MEILPCARVLQDPSYRSLTLRAWCLEDIVSSDDTIEELNNPFGHARCLDPHCPCNVHHQQDLDLEAQWTEADTAGLHRALVEMAAMPLDCCPDSFEDCGVCGSSALVFPTPRGWALVEA